VKGGGVGKGRVHGGAALGPNESHEKRTIGRRKHPRALCTGLCDPMRSGLSRVMSGGQARILATK
jgi:hypothetical protein